MDLDTMLTDPAVQESAERVRTCRGAIEREAAELVAKVLSGDVILIGGDENVMTLRALIRASQNASRDFRNALTAPSPSTDFPIPKHQGVNTMKDAITVDEAKRTITPKFSEGDDYYGLSLGSNGTAAACRRACVAVSTGAMGYTWVRSDGRPATGLFLVPSADSDSTPSPWEGV